MLQIIRDKTSGWIASAIMALLMIPFAFWGINYYFTGGTEPVVASVNGTDIKLTEFQRTFNIYRQQMQNLAGKSLQPGDDEILKQQTVGQLVNTELMNQATDEAGLYASDAHVRETIKNIDVFKGADGFNRDFYEQSVQRLGMPPAMYEQQMRIDMMAEQFQSAIIETEFVTPGEAETVARLSNQLRDITYTIISSDLYKDGITVSDEEIEKFYQSNPALYIKPEEVRIGYIHLKLDDLAAKVEAGEDALRDYYESNKAEYDAEEQRQINQILIKTAEDGTEEETAAAKVDADKILAQLRSGQTFADVAKAYAENKDPDFSFTEYGFLPKGVMEDEVEVIVFAMNKDEISDVIKSKLGFHIVELKDIKGGVMNTFENNREKVEQDYRRKQAEKEFFDLADRLANTAYEHPDTLEIAASETGIGMQESGLFTRSGTGEGLLADPRVLNAAFSGEVLGEGHNSDVIEINETELLVLRVLERSPEARRPLAEVRDQVIDDIKFSAASRKAAELGEQVMADLKAGKDFATVATERAVKWEEARDLKRSDVKVSRVVLRTAFRLGLPQEQKPAVGGVSLGTGDYAVVAVMSVRDPAPEDLKDVEIEKTGKELLADRARASMQQVTEQMKASADIKIFEDRLQ